MGLERYARRHAVGKRGKVIRARIPDELYEKFKEHCQRLGLTVSEGVFLLIRDEVDKPDYTAATAERTADYVRITRRPQTSYARRSGGGRGGSRGVVSPYVVAGRVPCPLCRKWYSRGNISRHMSAHDTTTEEAYKEYKEIVEQMVREARGIPAEQPTDSEEMELSEVKGAKRPEGIEERRSEADRRDEDP